MSHLVASASWREFTMEECLANLGNRAPRLKLLLNPQCLGKGVLGPHRDGTAAASA